MPIRKIKQSTRLIRQQIGSRFSGFNFARFQIADLKPNNMRISKLGRAFTLNRSLHTSAQRRNIALMNIIAIFRSAMFIIPVIMPFAHVKAGITPGQFLMAEAIFALCVVLMEIPTGWVSDIWTRKMSLFLGIVLEIVGFIILWNVGTLWHLLVSQAIIGVGISLISGTVSALLYDTLLEVRLESHFRRLEGLRHGLGLYSIGATSIIGGLLFAVSPDLPMALTIAALVIAGLCCFGLHEPERVREAVHKNPIKDMIVTIDRSVRKDTYTGKIILVCAIIFGITNTAFWLQQPYYIALGIPVGLFGFFSAGGHIIGGIGAQLAHIAERHMRLNTILLAMILWLATAFFISGAFPGLWGAFLLMSGGTIYGMGFPIMQDEINKRVSSARRATVLSCASLAFRIVFVTMGLSLGGFLDELGASFALLIISIVLCGFGGGFWFLLRTHKDKAPQ